MLASSPTRRAGRNNKAAYRPRLHTWEEACNIDGEWDGNVRVTTLKLAKVRVTREWLKGEPETAEEKSDFRDALDLLAKVAK
ncbi:hypothetical protein EDF69_002464 [Sphingomonas sp. JUb134]|nr:hypothetical protein [Sphingomonas sp. JUb134]